jgi:hypothetical protein
VKPGAGANILVIPWKTKSEAYLRVTL